MHCSFKIEQIVVENHAEEGNDADVFVDIEFV